MIITFRLCSFRTQRTLVGWYHFWLVLFWSGPSSFYRNWFDSWNRKTESLMKNVILQSISCIKFEFMWNRINLRNDTNVATRDKLGFYWFIIINNSSESKSWLDSLWAKEVVLDYSQNTLFLQLSSWKKLKVFSSVIIPMRRFWGLGCRQGIDTIISRSSRSSLFGAFNKFQKQLLLATIQLRVVYE